MGDPVLLSILVPTMPSRAALFDALIADLRAQIARPSAQDVVEIVVNSDDGAMTIGAKRNAMIAVARGVFTVSVDDDDAVHADYVSLILTQLRASPDVDCLGINGVMQFQTGENRPFQYSIAHPNYVTRDGVMLRPPHHLNPIRRAIALNFPYEDVRAHEDSDVALRMMRAGALRREVMIEPVLYHYRTRRAYPWHHLLERTEALRHPLMLQRVHMLRLRRGLRQLVHRKTVPKP